MLTHKSVYLLLLTVNLYAISIIERPIIFNKQRIDLTKEYIKTHYAIEVDSIEIVPRIIVVHWTAINDLERSIKRFIDPTLPSDRPDIQNASALNVSTHFMIDKDGTIYALMPETFMARHVIGLNYSSIGIENVGGEGNIDNLTPAQFKANTNLIAYLTDKYKSITYLIGHHEYTRFDTHPLWLEKDSHYRTLKYDPGETFIHKLRSVFPELTPAPETK